MAAKSKNKITNRKNRTITAVKIDGDKNISTAKDNNEATKENDTANDRRHTSISGAIVHLVEILIISLAIIVICTELFRGSGMGNVFILMFISVYIVFSFARKYWTERKQKNIMEAIDVTLTLVGGSTLLILTKFVFNFNQSDDTAGNALAKTIFGGVGSQPHIIIFYLGMLLLIIGAIRIYMMNKTHHRLNN